MDARTDSGDGEGVSEKELIWRDKRLKAALCVQAGMSLRKAAENIGGVSHQFVRNWARKLLVIGTAGGGENALLLKDGHEGIVRSKKPGPEPGRCPKVDEIIERVKAEKEKPFRQDVGAMKIKVMSGVDASVNTVSKALKKAGFKPVEPGRRHHGARVCKAVPDQQWDIDLVEIGFDSQTGKKVSSMSVEDDHSRYAIGTYVAVEPTADGVIAALEGMIKSHGKPKAIRTDHGDLWYTCGPQECEFDVWCRKMRIRHEVTAVKAPQHNGKVERFQESIRKESHLPRKATPEAYWKIMEEYRMFYNMERPHWALGLRTPSEVYYKTEKSFAAVEKLVRSAWEIATAGTWDTDGPAPGAGGV